MSAHAAKISEVTTSLHAGDIDYLGDECLCKKKNFLEYTVAIRRNLIYEDFGYRRCWLYWKPHMC
jgi:hypothetical protein